MTIESINNQNDNQETEIDFIHLARAFWIEKLLFGKIILGFIVLGFFVAILIPNQFMASSTIIPQISDPKSKLSGLSGLSGMAALAGINLNPTTSSELSPRTYSSIVLSVPFQLELMQTHLNFEKIDTSITLYDYYTKIKSQNFLVKYTIGLPSVILKKIKGEKKSKFSSIESDQLYVLSEKQIEVQKIIENQLSISVNDLDGSVLISCSLPEAFAAAELVLSAQNLLQSYITRFKIEKAKTDLEFVQLRYNESKSNYQKAQQQLAIFRDRNMNASTAVAKSEEERLNSEYSLQNGIYAELSKKLEQAKINVKEETPIFTVIKPVSVPTKKSRPNRPIILAISAFVGLIAGFVYILGKDFFHKTIDKWRSFK
jgi:uncharacterized protein involved in exopolysaccharide biosynthesis